MIITSKIYACIHKFDIKTIEKNTKTKIEINSRYGVKQRHFKVNVFIRSRFSLTQDKKLVTKSNFNIL
jgi:hypothetical protein